MATKASLSQGAGSGLQVIRVRGDTPRTLLFISSTHRFLRCLFHFSSCTDPPPSPPQCLWCQTGVITGQGKSLFFFSLFLSVRQKTKQHGPKHSAVWPTGRDVRSACVCVCRLQGKAVERKVKLGLTLMQIDEQTQHRLTCAHRCLEQSESYSSHIDSLQPNPILKTRIYFSITKAGRRTATPSTTSQSESGT